MMVEPGEIQAIVAAGSAVSHTLFDDDEACAPPNETIPDPVMALAHNTRQDVQAMANFLHQRRETVHQYAQAIFAEV